MLIGWQQLSTACIACSITIVSLTTVIASAAVFSTDLDKRLRVRCIQDEGQEPKEEKVIVLQLVEDA